MDKKLKLKSIGPIGNLREDDGNNNNHDKYMNTEKFLRNLNCMFLHS